MLLCEFGSGLKSFILPHGPRWGGGGGLQHRQNKRSADKQRHKEACRLKPVAFILPERKLFGKVLIPVLLLCHFTETKKRLLDASQKTLFEKIIPSTSAMKAHQMDFRIILNICDISYLLAHGLIWCFSI